MSPATIIVGIVILIAVIYMVRHVRGMFNGSSGCSCCDGRRQLLLDQKIKICVGKEINKEDSLTGILFSYKIRSL